MTTNMIRLSGALLLTTVIAACGEGPASPGAAETEASAPAVAVTPPTAVGEAGNAEGSNYTVTSVETANQLGAAGIGPKAEAGETFVVVSYTIKNTADAPLTLMERPALSLVDGNGQSYATDDMATMMAAGMMDDPSGMASDLNPNVSAKTKAAWKVDKASFDKATWRVVVASDPALTFALN